MSEGELCWMPEFTIKCDKRLVCHSDPSAEGEESPVWFQWSLEIPRQSFGRRTGEE